MRSFGSGSGPCLVLHRPEVAQRLELPRFLGVDRGRRGDRGAVLRETLAHRGVDAAVVEQDVRPFARDRRRDRTAPACGASM